MNTAIIELWEEKISILEKLISAHDKTSGEFAGDLLAIMIGRKNQLEECIKDFKKHYSN